MDSSGNLYTSQEFRGLLRKIDTTGTITTIAGNNEYRFSPDGVPAVSAQVRSPAYLTVGPDGGTVYFLSTNGLRKIGTDGILNTASDNAPFRAPSLVGTYCGRSREFLHSSEQCGDSVNGSFWATIQAVVNQSANGFGSSGDGGPALIARLNSPSGLAADKAGNLFTVDTGNNKIRKVTAG